MHSKSTCGEVLCENSSSFSWSHAHNLIHFYHVIVSINISQRSHWLSPVPLITECSAFYWVQFLLALPTKFFAHCTLRVSTSTHCHVTCIWSGAECLHLLTWAAKLECKDTHLTAYVSAACSQYLNSVSDTQPGMWKSVSSTGLLRGCGMLLVLKYSVLLLHMQSIRVPQKQLCTF